MASAEDVGKKLLAQVEGCGLDEILRELHVQDQWREKQQAWNFPPLDRLLCDAGQDRPQANRSSPIHPMVELMSITAGGGKTHLLYHLCALAVLPRTFGGIEACSVIIDTNGKFSVSRLAAQLQLLLRRRKSTESNDGIWEEELNAETLSALRHIHIFRPQTLASTIATLDTLPAHLFNQDRHYSFDREVAFIALDSASAFYWQDRSETENATFLAKTTENTNATQISGFFQLATALKKASKTFDCPVIFTTWYLGPQQKSGDGSTVRGFRPQIPPLQANLRLVVRRVPVPKFPAGLSLEGAVRDANDRQKAVAEGRFECFVNEWSLEERPYRQSTAGGFEFRILADGLVVEKEEEELAN